MPISYFDEFIDNALREDIGDGDHTSRACIPSDAAGKAQLLVKEAGILSGVNVAVRIFHKIDRRITIELIKHDGDSVAPPDIAFVVEGRIRALLKAERLVLNVMQRMSGIATSVSLFAEKISLIAITKSCIVQAGAFCTKISPCLACWNA
jgi:nicotinate-nucleotide pyrophosphorylase (carboxylating)